MSDNALEEVPALLTARCQECGDRLPFSLDEPVELGHIIDELSANGWAIAKGWTWCPLHWPIVDSAEILRRGATLSNPPW